MGLGMGSGVGGVGLGLGSGVGGVGLGLGPGVGGVGLGLGAGIGTEVVRLELWPAQRELSPRPPPPLPTCVVHGGELVLVKQHRLGGVQRHLVDHLPLGLPPLVGGQHDLCEEGGLVGPGVVVGHQAQLAGHQEAQLLGGQLQGEGGGRGGVKKTGVRGGDARGGVGEGQAEARSWVGGGRGSPGVAAPLWGRAAASSWRDSFQALGWP